MAHTTPKPEQEDMGSCDAADAAGMLLMCGWSSRGSLSPFM
jgi:hypothetical protein